MSTNMKRSHRHSENDRNKSPRRSHRDDNKSSSNYARSRPRSPLNRPDDERANSDSSKSNYHTLYVRNFSSKLSIDMIQDSLFREFDKFGSMSINVGHLDGERAALITFQHSGDAREAYRSKPKIYLNDRSVNVEILRDSVMEEQPRAKIRPGSRGARDTNLSGEPANQFGAYHAPKLMDNNFADLFAKSNPMIPCGTNSLLGIPCMNPSGMMAAAAARALGLSAPPVPLNETPPNFPLLFPNLNVGSRFVGSGSQQPYRFDASGGVRSPPISESEKDMKATRTLFVGSLEPDITEAEVRDTFCRFGVVEQIDIKRTPKVGANAYAFIRYENVDMAYRARNAMSGRRVRSLHCKIGYGKPIPTPCLYVSGLSRRMREEAAHQLFTRFGPVDKIDFSQFRGCAHVRYSTLDSACNANNQLRGLRLEDDRRRRLRVDFINPDVMHFGIDEKREHPHFTGQDLDGVGLNDQKHMDTNPNNTANLGSRNFLLERSNNRCHGFMGSTHKPVTDPKEVNQLTLHSVISLEELDNCLQPEIWRGRLLLKTSQFCFRCLHVVGDAEVSSYVGRASNLGSKTPDEMLHPILRISRRGQIDHNWMTEATDCIQAVLSNRQRGLCLMLLLPDLNDTETEVQENPQKLENCSPLRVLVAYFKLKQSIGIAIPMMQPKAVSKTDDGTENAPDCGNSSLTLHLFPPSSFCLGLLKMAAPNLNPELAASDAYMLLLAMK